MPPLLLCSFYDYFFFGNFIMSKIANTVAFTGPLDDVAVVDVYTAKPPTETVNRITQEVAKTAENVKTDLTSLAKETMADAVDAAKAIVSPTNIVKQILAGEFDKSLLGNLPTSKEEALGKLTAIADSAIGNINALRNLKGNFLADVLSSVGFKDNAKELANGILGLPGSTDPITTVLGSNPKLKIIYDSVSFVKNQGDINSVTGAVSLINGVLGNSDLAKVIDTESQFALMGNAIKHAQALGIPGIADAFMEKAETPEEKATLALQLARNAFSHPALDTISTIMANISKERLEVEIPDASNQLLENYAIPNTDGNAFPTATHTTDLTDALTSIKSNWYTYRRNGVDIVDLSVYLTMSKDAQDVLKLDPIHRVNVMIAQQQLGHSTDTFALFSKHFPTVSIKR